LWQTQTAGMNPAARYKSHQIFKEPTPYFPLLRGWFKSLFGHLPFLSADDEEFVRSVIAHAGVLGFGQRRR
ncbi:MAG: hypothetical protein J0M17_24905, partial [Planctomycetes bacterium]|nr:hypothetical protein [Planctomycetota bacterium]